MIRPSAPMDREAAIAYLRSQHELSEHDASDLLDRAVQRRTGMASHPRSNPHQRTVWATHMTTLGGTFIIEVE